MLEKILKNAKKSLCALALSLPLLSCESPNPRTNIWEDPYGSVMADISTGYKHISVSEKAIPDAVKAEAANPSITNPHTGNTFNKDQIPPYNPSDSLSFAEISLEAKYIFPRIPFFIGGDLNFPFYIAQTKYGGQIKFDDPRSDNGFSGKDYSNSVLIDATGREKFTPNAPAGCDTINYDPYRIMYFYGIRYSPWIARPMVGFHLEMGNDKTRFFLEPTLKYEEAELSYIKGLESSGGRHLRIRMAEETLRIYDTSIKIGVLNKSKQDTGLIKNSFESGIFLYGGPLFTNKEGVAGWSIGFGFGVNF